MANKNEHTSSSSRTNIEDNFWRMLQFSPTLYGADSVGSMFPDSVKEWNLNCLQSYLGFLGNRQLPGINQPMLYFGQWKALFAWHVEDMNLYSINYLHFGKPKQWYVIPAKDGPELEKYAKQMFPTEFKKCSQFLRHKTTLIKPDLIKQRHIRVTRVVQNPGEFVIVLPYAYHSGFNHGFNCAEAVNFATKRWFEYGHQAKTCFCHPDTVHFDMIELENRLYAFNQKKLPLSKFVENMNEIMKEFSELKKPVPNIPDNSLVMAAIIDEKEMKDTNQNLNQNLKQKQKRNFDLLNYWRGFFPSDFVLLDTLDHVFDSSSEYPHRTVLKLNS